MTEVLERAKRFSACPRAHGKSLRWRWHVAEHLPLLSRCAKQSSASVDAAGATPGAAARGDAALRRAGDGRKSERVNATRKDLIALAVSPGVPGGAIVAEEGQQVAWPAALGVWAAAMRGLGLRSGSAASARVAGSRSMHLSHPSIGGYSDGTPRIDTSSTAMA